MTAAFAIDRLAIGRRLAQPAEKSCRGLEPVRPKLWIAARQVDRIRGRAGRFVREWRKEREFGALTPPALEERRISKTECHVARYGNALT